jgi:hypothetical protein
MVKKLLNIKQFLDNIFIENSFKCKLQIIRDFGCTVGVVGKPLVVRI